MDLHQYIDALLQEAPPDEAPDAGDRTGLFSRRRLDSLQLLNLIMFVENQVGQQLDDADLTTDSFDSADAIAALMDRYAAGNPSRADARPAGEPG